MKVFDEKTTLTLKDFKECKAILPNCFEKGFVKAVLDTVSMEFFQNNYSKIQLVIHRALICFYFCHMAEEGLCDKNDIITILKEFEQVEKNSNSKDLIDYFLGKL